jgi:hypothetical protein
VNAHQKVIAGAALIVAGSLMIHAGYEGSGRRRPWAIKLLPGA